MDLLIVDDDSDFRQTVVHRFRGRGHRVREAESASQALQSAAKEHFDVALIDLVMPGMDGIQLLEKLKEADPECQVVMLTGHGSIDTAVDAMKRGAYDYVTKPCPLSELEVLLGKAFERHELSKENRQLRAALRRFEPSWEIVGQSAAMCEVLRLIEKVAPTDSSVLIQGESGTGKELVARAVHQRSVRAEKPMVVINCAALQETLLESELFGHERGAFTGAVAAKPGLFEVADGGTLFIDEIGEMTGGLQAKLLRVLEDGKFRPVGSTKERRVDVRIIAASNRNLSQEVQTGRFRDDLYFRIDVLTISLPPLRERQEDIPLLIEHFLKRSSTKVWHITPEARGALLRYPWPGNVRELANVIERAKILAEGDTIQLEDLPTAFRESGTRLTETSRLPDSVTAVVGTDNLALWEAQHVAEVLHREGGNKARAAKALGISRRSLYRLLEKHKIRIAERFDS